MVSAVLCLFFLTKISIGRRWNNNWLLNSSYIRQCGTHIALTILTEFVSYRFPKPVKKVLLLPNNDSYPLCPRCGFSLEREYMAFCDRCGQHLTWKIFPLVIVHYKSSEAEIERWIFKSVSKKLQNICIDYGCTGYNTVFIYFCYELAIKKNLVATTPISVWGNS